MIARLIAAASSLILGSYTRHRMIFRPPSYLCTDSAAMVAACGYYHFQTQRISGYNLDVVPSLSLG